MKQRFDIISDTHGYLSPQLLRALEGADRIVHAGDICSPSNYQLLSEIAPVSLCLGNNDWAYDYGPEVKDNKIFFAGGLMWQVNHFYERLNPERYDIAIFGHTHRPKIHFDEAANKLVMNPGSASYPRDGFKPSIGRVFVEDGNILSAEILNLEDLA